MKTLLVTLDFPPLLGGIANYYFNLVNKMPADEVVVLMNKIDKQLTTNNKQQFKVYYKNFFTKLIWPHWLPLIWHTYHVARKEKINMLWVGQVLPVGSAIYIVSKLLHLPYFVSCHGNDLLRAKSYLRKFKLAKKILHNAEHIEANTQFTKNILIKDFSLPENRIRIVYPETTLDPSQVDKNKAEELKRKYHLHNKKVLLTVARLVKSKGVNQVIRALPRVWEDVPNLVYLIVGDGVDKNRLTQMVDRLPSASAKATTDRQIHRSKIIFTGAVLHNELVNYYALADLFILTPHRQHVNVLPSKIAELDTESFGIVYLEALKFNLPIIAGDVGGMREIKNSPPLEGGGWGRYNKINLVDSENIDEIAKKIISIL